MYFAFSQEQEEFRDGLRRLLTGRAPASRVREAIETGSAEDVWKVLTQEMAVTGLHVPEELGGQGFTLQETALVMQELGRTLAPVPVLATVLAIEAIRIAGTPAQQQELVPALAAGDRAGAVAATSSHDLMLDGVGVTAEAARDGHTLTGSHPLVLDGHLADLLVIPALEDGSVQLFVVEAGATGLRVTRRPSLDLTRPVAMVELAEVAARRLDGAGGPRALERFADVARLLLTFESLGGAERCLELAVDYAGTRRQFNRPIGSFQAIKHLCADMAIELDASWGVAMYAAMTADADPASFAAVASLAKAQASEVFTQCASGSIQVHGGIGFTWEHDCHLYYRRAKANEVLFGDIDELRALSIDGSSLMAVV